MKTIKVHYIELAFVLANDAIINGDSDGSKTWAAAYWLGKGLGGKGVYLF